MNAAVGRRPAPHGDEHGRALVGEERIEQPAHALRIPADEVMGDERPLALAPFDQLLGDQDIRRLSRGDGADAQVPAQRRLRRQALPRRRSPRA